MTWHSLKLANGQEWQFIADEGTRSWSEKLFSIMRLHASEPNHSPKIIFVNDSPKHSRIDKLPLELPEAGWIANDLKSMVIWTHPDTQDVFCQVNGDIDKTSDSARFMSTFYPIYKRAIYSGGFPFHAALVKLNGKGVLLAAESGTGKSTCSRRIPPPWEAISDDETLVVKDNSGQYFVHPFPTLKNYLSESGQQSWDVQYHLPVSAIFFLEQARFDQVLPLGKGKAALSISDSVLQICDRYRMWISKDEMKDICAEIFNNACALSNAVPSYILRVSLSGKFWEEIEKVIL